MAGYLQRLVTRSVGRPAPPTARATPPLRPLLAGPAGFVEEVLTPLETVPPERVALQAPPRIRATHAPAPEGPPAPPQTVRPTPSLQRGDAPVTPSARPPLPVVRSEAPWSTWPAPQAAPSGRQEPRPTPRPSQNEALPGPVSPRPPSSAAAAVASVPPIPAPARSSATTAERPSQPEP